MQIEKLKITDLKPADYNPRKKLKTGDKEFEKLKGSVAQTVNYGSAITDISNVSGDVLTTEEEQIRAAAALEEEEDLLGARLGMLGVGSLKGLK